MEAALAWALPRFDLLELTTSAPELYEPFGFRRVPLSRFRIDQPGGGRGGATPVRPDDPADLARLHALLAERAPVSEICAPRDPGWLLGIDEVLGDPDLGDLRWLDDLDALVAWSLRDGLLVVYDIVARELPPLADVLDHAPPHHGVELTFTPDRFDCAPRIVCGPTEDVYMVREARASWPLVGPVGVSPLWSH
jgi:hypothetical protein